MVRRAHQVPLPRPFYLVSTKQSHRGPAHHADSARHRQTLSFVWNDVARGPVRRIVVAEGPIRRARTRTAWGGHTGRVTHAGAHPAHKETRPRSAR